MAIPAFNRMGDLPVGDYQVTLSECLQHFGESSEKRRQVSAKLVEISRIANRTGKLDRIVVFGSYVTAKTEPGDIHIILVMKDDFDVEKCDASAQPLFNHHRADVQFGASVFWIRPAVLLLDESLESFIARWQVKRDGGRRGIREIRL